MVISKHKKTIDTEQCNNDKAIVVWETY